MGLDKLLDCRRSLGLTLFPVSHTASYFLDLVTASFFVVTVNLLK